jgi:hypothetical protein
MTDEPPIDAVDAWLRAWSETELRQAIEDPFSDELPDELTLWHLVDEWERRGLGTREEAYKLSRQKSLRAMFRRD